MKEGSDAQSHHVLQGLHNVIACCYVIRTLTEIQVVTGYRPSKGDVVEEFLTLVEACHLVAYRRPE